MTDLSGGLAGGVSNLVGGVLGGVRDLLGGPGGGATQVVAQAGDTLGSIADAHGVPLATVVDANPQVLHPDLVQAGQAITVPPPPAGAQAGPPAAAPPAGADAPPTPAQGAAGQGLSQTIGQVGQAVGQTLGGVGQAAQGLLAGGPPPPTGTAASPLPGSTAQTQPSAAPAQVSQTQTGPVPAPADAAAPALPSGLAVLAAGGPAAADFRVLSQAAPPLAQPVTPATTLQGAAPTLMQALAGIDPSLAALLARALSAPSLSTPASAAQLAKLETALLSLGWSAVALGLARPGDVVLLLRTAMLQAARVPDEGPAALVGAQGSGTADARALGPPQPGAPSGVDAAAPGRLRPRAPGEDAGRPKTDEDRTSRRDPPPSPERAWIDRALPAARAVKARWGVPIAVTLAQGAAASDWGRIAPGNDYFGLGERRAGLPALPPPRAGGRLLLGSPVQAFLNVDEAAEAFGAWLAAEPCFAYAFRSPDPATFATRIAEAGVAADPRHATVLRDLIETYALHAFDG